MIYTSLHLLSFVHHLSFCWSLNVAGTPPPHASWRTALRFSGMRSGTLRRPPYCSIFRGRNRAGPRRQQAQCWSAAVAPAAITWQRMERPDKSSASAAKGNFNSQDGSWLCKCLCALNVLGIRTAQISALQSSSFVPAPPG